MKIGALCLEFDCEVGVKHSILPLFACSRQNRAVLALRTTDCARSDTLDIKPQSLT